MASAPARQNSDLNTASCFSRWKVLIINLVQSRLLSSGLLGVETRLRSAGRVVRMSLLKECWAFRLSLPNGHESTQPNSPKTERQDHSPLGDAINAVLAGAGYNFRRLIRWLQLLLRQILAQLDVPPQVIPG